MRIQDYGSFSVQKKKNFTSEYTFTSSLGFLDVKIVNRPPELSNIDDLECEIEYEAQIERKKDGIQDINFKVNLIELEVKVDDFPNDPREFEFDIVPGENIDNNYFVIKKEERLIPSKPSFLHIDMRKSMKIGDFKIDIHFGKNG
jgi:hypothetical protein